MTRDWSPDRVSARARLNVAAGQRLHQRAHLVVCNNLAQAHFQVLEKVPHVLLAGRRELRALQQRGSNQSVRLDHLPKMPRTFRRMEEATVQVLCRKPSCLSHHI